MTNTAATDTARMVELDRAAAHCPTNNSWHAQAIAAGMTCECGATAPLVTVAPKRRPFVRTLVTTALLAVLSASHGAPTTAAQVVPPCAPHDYSCVSPGMLAPGVDLTAPYDSRYFPETDNDRVAQCLVDNGYRGLADDGLEAIYAPHEAIEACSGVSL